MPKKPSSREMIEAILKGIGHIREYVELGYSELTEQHEKAAVFDDYRESIEFVDASERFLSNGDYARLEKVMKLFAANCFFGHVITCDNPHCRVTGIMQVGLTCAALASGISDAKAAEIAETN